MNLNFSLPTMPATLQNKAYIKFSLLGLLLYFFFLITTIPAEWLAWSANKYSRGSITLTQPGGTIWKGSGQLSVSFNRGKSVNLGYVEWNTQPLWLLIGQIDTNLSLTSKGLQLYTHLAVSPGSLSVSDLKASIQADKLGAFYSPASLMSPTGQINLSSKEFSVSKDGIEGSAEGQWTDAGSGLSAVKPLGTYKLKVTGKGDIADFSLDANKNSSLHMTGKGKWTLVNGLINFNGTASPKNKKAELESLLILIGRDLGAGKRVLRLNTRLPFSYIKKQKSKK